MPSNPATAPGLFLGRITPALPLFYHIVPTEETISQIFHFPEDSGSSPLPFFVSRDTMKPLKAAKK